MAHQALLLAATDRIVTGTGIANVWSRHPASLEGGSALLGAAYPGRFIAGHRHQPRPDGGLERADLRRSHWPAWPAISTPCRRRPSNAPPGQLARAPRAGSPASAHAGPGPGARRRSAPLLRAASRTLRWPAPPWDRTSSSSLSRRWCWPPIPPRPAASPAPTWTCYLRLPNYVNNLKRLGFTDDDVADGGSDRLVDAVVAWGDEEAILARVRDHLDGGADHVLIQPLGALDTALLQLTELAPVLVGV